MHQRVCLSPSKGMDSILTYKATAVKIAVLSICTFVLKAYFGSKRTGLYIIVIGLILNWSQN